MLRCHLLLEQTSLAKEVDRAYLVDSDLTFCCLAHPAVLNWPGVLEELEAAVTLPLHA